MKRKELVEKRSLNGKVFENEDHTFTAALYDYPIHYQEDGVWKEIDNTLSIPSYDAGNMEGTEEVWENTRGLLKVKFANKAKEKKTVCIKKGNAKLEWGLSECKKVKGTLKTQKEKSEDDDIFLKKLRSEIRYEEIVENVDLQYFLIGEELKENLILKTRECQNEFIFFYRTENIVPEEKGGKIVFLDGEKNEIFILAAPYMRDANGTFSKEISLHLEKGEKKEEWKVILKADSEWLVSKERAYPVVIDPSITTPVTYSKVVGNIVSSANGDLLDITNSDMVVSGRENVRRAMFRFELPQMEPGDMVVDAKMQLVSRNTDFYQRRFHLHRILQDWEPEITCWYNKPIYEEQILDTCEYLADEIKLIGFNITDIVKDWYENGKNYGVLLKMEDETNAQQTLLLGPGSHEGLSDLRPHILITYVNYAGLEGYWTYHTQTVGRAGTAYVNDYNGNLIFIHSTLSMRGNRMPICLKQIYNNTDYKNNIGYGLGFRLNYHQTIEKVTIGNWDYYKYIDGDGTAHYFYEKEEESGKIWKDENGSETTLTFGNTDQDQYILKNKKNKQLIFDKNGLLVSVKDNNGNELKITYTDKKITKITDGVGRVTTLQYTDGLLTSVTDPSNRVKKFSYDNKKQLTTITDIDEEIMILAYSNVVTGLLKEIHNIDDYMIRYAYTGGNPRRIRRVCEYAGTEKGNALNMDYGYNRTKFTDDRGKEEIYLFNNHGNTISIKNDQGYGMIWKFNENGNHTNSLTNQSQLQLVTAQLLKDPMVQKTDIWKGTSTVSTIKAELVNTTEAKIGDRCMKIVSTDKTGVGRFYQDIEIPRGREFTFSAYLNMKVTELGEYGGCYLSLYYKDKEGTLKSVTCKRIETSGNTWKLLSLPFTMPSDASDNTVTVNVVLRNMKGELYADDLQVEWGLTTNRHNLVTNGDLTYTTLDQFEKRESDDCDKIVLCGDETELPITGLAKIIPGVASVYKGPGTNYEKETDVWAGNPVVILGWTKDKTDKKWYRIRTQYDMTGFLQEEELAIFIAGGNGLKTGTIVRDNVTVYQQANTSSPINVLVFKDTQVVIHGSEKDSTGTLWYQVGFNSNVNWCAGYIKASEIAENCTNEAKGKTKTVLSAYYYPDLGSGIVRNLEPEQTVFIRGSYRDASGELWYMIPSFLSGKAATYGYVKANDLNMLTAPVAEIKNTEIVPAGNGNLNGRVYKIVGDPKKTKKLTQVLELPGKKGDCYMVNAWGKGSSIPLTAEDRKFGVEICFIAADGTEDIHTSNFGADTKEWQYLSDAVVAKEDYSKIEVSYVYGKNVNVAYFDGLSLYKEEYGVSFKYDEDGNVISVIDAEKKAMELEYDDDNNLTSMTTPTGKNFSYEYDDKHNVTSSVSAESMKTTLKYNQYGNVIEQKRVNKSNEKEYIKATAAYTSDGNYCVSKTDAFGNTIANEWYPTLGILNSRTDARGNKVYFRYNLIKQMTATSTKVTSDGKMLTPRITYEYTKDYLTKIGHNGFFYTFDYDSFGRKKAVKIADTTLITKEYEEQNGHHISSTYGNGCKIRYVYNTMNFIKEIYIKEKEESKEQKFCTFTYNKQGNIVKVENYLTGKTYEYSYNLLGRIGKIVDEKGNSYEYTYNENNGIKNIYRTVGKSYVTVSYAYDKDEREIAVATRGKKRTTTYDALGRVSTQKWNTTTPFTTILTYVDGPKDENGIIAKTARIEKMKNGNDTITYEYDVNGNITKIQDNEGTSTYEYDEMNQMVRENNHILNKTVTYIYDVGGNLVTKREYAYTTQSLPTEPVKTVICTYDTKWKDKITSFDGKIFTYDEIGNPLSYGDISYEWCRGRKLKKVNNGKEISYEYNVNGTRCSKTINGVKTEYQVLGQLITSETTNGETIWYNYDSVAHLVSIIYNHKDYFYIRNAQGDIIALIDTLGNEVVKYQYDSWGNTLKISGTMASTLGKKNPFRYRGYYYDEETNMYYLKSRYYIPEIGRFLNADCYISTGQGFNGNNMFQYCGNNPINWIDPNGKIAVSGWLFLGGLLGMMITGLTGCGATGKRKANLPDLGDSPEDWNDHVFEYNCYGWAIHKRINGTEQGSLWLPFPNGTTVEQLYEEVKKDVGAENVRIADISYNPKEGERLVAMKVGKTDYHFAVKIKATWEDGEEYKWTSKGGFTSGVILDIPEKLIAGETWGQWELLPDGTIITPREAGTSEPNLEMYTSETIYFVLQEDWDD